MKNVEKFLFSFGTAGVILFMASVLSFILFMMFVSLYGIYLAFSASVLLGIVVFLVEPSPAVIGLVMLFFHKDLAQMIMDFLSK